MLFVADSACVEMPWCQLSLTQACLGGKSSVSSIYDQIGNGPFTLKWPGQLQQRPFLVTASLIALLDCPAEKRPSNFYELLKDAWAQFQSLRMTITSMLWDHSWKTKRWNTTDKVFLNLRCERCTLPEARRDYLLSLPPALGIRSGAYLADGRNTAIENAYTELYKRAEDLFAELGHPIELPELDRQLRIRVGTIG